MAGGSFGSVGIDCSGIGSSEGSREESEAVVCGAGSGCSADRLGLLSRLTVACRLNGGAVSSVMSIVSPVTLRHAACPKRPRPYVVHSVHEDIRYMMGDHGMAITESMASS